MNTTTNYLHYLWVMLWVLLISPTTNLQAQDFTLEQVRSYAFPSSMTASASEDRIAWVMHEQGLRNIYVAEGPNFKARKLTNYSEDDGQELTSVSISNDGKWVVYLRGGEHGSNWDDEVTMNPLSTPFPAKVQIWSIPFKGGEPNLLGEGASPIIHPDGEAVTFTKSRQIWSIPIDGSGKAEQLLSLRGSNSSPKWSPDGSKMAFVSSRGDHGFIGIYQGPDQRIQWIAPNYDRDYLPRWSPDGKSIVFVRRNGGGGAPEAIIPRRHTPWKLMRYDLESKSAKVLWEAPKTLWGSIPRTHGGINLHWANGRIVFLSYQDGWPHLYSMDEDGGQPKLLTPGEFMCEYISLGNNGKTLVFSGNTGPDQFDIDRRHIVKVDIDGSNMEVLTPGEGNEWAPVITSSGQHLAYISATAQRPPAAAVMPLKGGKTTLLATDRTPKDFPTDKLVTPKQAVFQSEDGLDIHATLFEREDIKGEKPAIVYIHGGPPRQMLLGWHYSSYYSNAYALNQYLANQGFVVISVNYRLGIGYGYEFHYPPNTSTRGCAEYKDIVAAGKWLAKQPQVDAERIGVYGGSYGGYLTAMALGRDSDLFATGVDIHGVHDRSSRAISYVRPDNYEKAPDAELALSVAWQSSPIAYVDGWTSPVLIIHADDDRNVAFSQSTDLVQRLRKKGVDMETMVVVDDSHHFMLYTNQLAVNSATAEYLVRKLKNGKLR